MTQPRPNADQVRRRFSASAVASALVVEFSGAGVCLGARRRVLTDDTEQPLSLR